MKPNVVRCPSCGTLWDGNRCVLCGRTPELASAHQPVGRGFGDSQPLGSFGNGGALGELSDITGGNLNAAL
jgi:hypothetical protein